MKSEPLPPKKPEGFGPQGTPIDKDAPMTPERNRQGIRVGRWCIMFDVLEAGQKIDDVLIVWDCLTGARMKISLDTEKAFWQQPRFTSG